MCAFTWYIVRSKLKVLYKGGRHSVSHYGHRLLLFAYLRSILVFTLVIRPIYDTFIVTFKIKTLFNTNNI